MNALLLIAALAAAPAGKTRLAKCESGKTGKLELFVERADDGSFTLSSADPAQPGRALTGVVTAARHQRLDKRHHAYRFELRDGALAQAAGLDSAHCKPDGALERCPVNALVVKLARGGAKEPGDDGLAALSGAEGIAMDNGGPQGCTVYASPALKALLAAKPR